MTVLVLEQHFLPTVEVHAMVKSGSAHDPPEKAGLANLVASLLDEGTTSRSSKQLAEQIDFVGGALEVRAAEDFTTASVRVLKKDADLGFTLLADILQHPAFHKPEFERIRSQVLGEIASDNDDPGHVAMKSFNQLVFHGHPYRWPLYGSEESLNKITHADVLGFYNREYTPSQVILTIVGDVTAEQVTDSCRPISVPGREVCSAAAKSEKSGTGREKDDTAHREGFDAVKRDSRPRRNQSEQSRFLRRHRHELHPRGRRILLAADGFHPRQTGTWSTGS